MPSPGPLPLNRDFADLLHELCAAQVRFLVVGAYALSVHAEPRATGDLDLWVAASAANARRVHRALERFGAPLADLRVGDLAREGTVFQIGIAPRRIDLLTSITGVTFARAWRDRVKVRFGATEVPVIGRAALIRNKLATARPKDLLDVAELRRRRRAPP